MKTSQVIDSVRQWSLAHLSQKNYARLARLFGFIAARIKERSIRKPLDQLVNCGLPLIYISQPPRSGGTLMRRLFDGHRSCLIFPHELSWQKNGFQWDDTLSGVNSSRRVYQILYDRWIDNAIARGIGRKYPFHFNRSLQKRIFFQSGHLDFHQDRHWLDRYMTSFFNAWIDYQNIYGPGKRYCVAFCPWNLQKVEEVERFYDFYPDGFRIHIVRNPLAWWASEKHYSASERKQLNKYLQPRWMKSTKIGLQFARTNPERYILVSFDNLIARPEESMRHICVRLDLPFDPVVLIPSFNNIPVKSNTSFGEGETGIDTSVLHRWQNRLTGEEIKEIRSIAGPLYDKALSRCINS